MKYQKTLFQVLLLLLIISITSCSKSAKEEPSHLAGKLKLIRGVGETGESKSEFTYDTKGFLISVNHTYSDAITGSTYEFQNNSDGKPVLLNIYAIKSGEAPKKYAKVNLTYQDKMLIEYKQVLEDGGFVSAQRYFYNNKNFLDSSTYTQNVDSSNPYVYERYVYTVDLMGIVTGQTRTTYPTGPGPSIKITTEKYEYDDKVNPLSNNTSALYRPNNTIKTTVKHDKIPDELIVVFAFDYNAAGLPVKEYVVENGVKKLVRIYEYY